MVALIEKEQRNFWSPMMSNPISKQESSGIATANAENYQGIDEQTDGS